ncbi:MAG: YceI family protein [Gammaproteobacteria bacterium]
MRKSTALLILVGLLVVGTGRAADWTLDDAESRLEFVADYTGSEISGQFRRFGVEFDFDADAPAAGRLAVSVDMLSADMGEDDMTDAVTGTAWLDAQAFATATFTSARIKQHADGEFAAHGTLDLKGIVRDVTVPFVWAADGDRATMRGTVVLQRLEFGVGTGTWAATDEVADDVRVVFDLALQKSD